MTLRLWPLLIQLALSACIEEDADDPAPTAAIRAVQTMVAEPLPVSVSRAFPTVLEPPQMTSLAFDMGGRLDRVDLQVGQRVTEGQVLLTLDAATIDLQLRQAEAALSEATSTMTGAREDADRQAALFARGVVAQAALDRANRTLEQAAARVEQARRQVDLVADSRAGTQLIAPFDAVVNTVEVQSFDTLQPGRVAVTIYPETNLQARILVSYDVVTRLRLGQRVLLRPADQGSDFHFAAVTEIADRAPAVSAFPVVITLEDVLPTLRSGMAAEVLIALAVGEEAGGMPVPLSALATHLTETLAPAGLDGGHRAGRVFILRRDGTLELRDVVLAGLDEARMIVVAGLAPGERVVTAGVPFLQPGQAVRLMDGVKP